MRISDWSSDVCSSDLLRGVTVLEQQRVVPVVAAKRDATVRTPCLLHAKQIHRGCGRCLRIRAAEPDVAQVFDADGHHALLTARTRISEGRRVGKRGSRWCR